MVLLSPVTPVHPRVLCSLKARIRPKKRTLKESFDSELRLTSAMLCESEEETQNNDEPLRANTVPEPELSRLNCSQSSSASNATLAK